MSSSAPTAATKTLLAISGFGRLAQNYYVPALKRLRDEAHVVSVADPAPACRAAAARLLPGATIFESQHEMLHGGGGPRLDGLLVASPPRAHLDALKGAAEIPGLAVFMEKPLVPPGEIDAVKRLPGAATRRLMVNFNRRFWPRYRRIAELVASGAIGRLVSAELELQVDVTKWLSVTQHRVETGQGGALYDLGSQMIDLAGVIAGERPVAVRATATSARWEADHVDVALTFPSGADVRCRLAYDAPTRERIIVRGADREARIDNPNMAEHVGPRGGGVLARAHDLFTFAGHAARRHTSMSRRTIELALAAFIDAIRTNGPFSPGFADAAFNASALEAAMRSLATGEAEPIVPAAAMEAVA